MISNYITITDLQNSTLGICKISHIPNEVKESFTLSQRDQEYYNNIRNSRRKNEWLATRILLNQMLDNNHQILYTENGKPYLKDHQYDLSISHSKEYATILLSSTKQVALDIENTKRRITHLKNKFVNNNETPQNDLDLFKIWCAKEAIFKLVNRHPIDLQNETIVDLRKEQIYYTTTNETFQLNFINIEEELLCYIIG